MLRLDFSRSDLNLPVMRTKTRRASIGLFSQRAGRVEAEVNASLLSQPSKERYLISFHDRLKAVSI